MRTSVLSMVVLSVLLSVGLLAGTGLAQETWVIGTSADYPPFESVDEDGEFVGFDMDLIREIGARLGRTVEIQDMDFGALIAALERGRVDAVIASMSPTPERRERVDFTDSYYQSRQGILIHPDTDVQIESLDDFMQYDFAVQTGTTMDDWATNRVEEGLIDPGQINRYGDVTVAGMDLRNRRVEAFMLDLAVAYSLAADLGLEVAIEVSIEEAGNPGILLPKGSDEEVALINGVLADLREEGFIDELIDTWLRGVYQD